MPAKPLSDTLFFKHPRRKDVIIAYYGTENKKDALNAALDEAGIVHKPQNEGPRRDIGAVIEGSENAGLVLAQGGVIAQRGSLRKKVFNREPDTDRLEIGESAELKAIFDRQGIKYASANGMLAIEDPTSMLAVHFSEGHFEGAAEFCGRHGYAKFSQR